MSAPPPAASSDLSAVAEPLRIEPVRMESYGDVRLIRLVQPEKRNALSQAMLAALETALAACDERCVRAIVIAAEGPVFSSGHDLKEINAARSSADGGQAFFADMLRRCAAVMQRIVALPAPVVAAVEGTATAAGCQLVASCDLAIAGAQARFCTPGVDIGLFCSTPMVAMARAMAPKHAMEMLLTADMIDAPTALRFALVNRVVPAGQALAAALELAQRIAGKSAQAIAFGKPAFYRQAEMGLAEAYAYAGGVMAENFGAADCWEGVAAFLEKRPAVWPIAPKDDAAAKPGSGK